MELAVGRRPREEIRDQHLNYFLRSEPEIQRSEVVKEPE